MRLASSTLLLIFLGVAAAIPHNDFDAWASKHTKHYATEDERSERLRIWMANDKIIEEHNSAGASPYMLGHNHFSDLTEEEFEASFAGLKGYDQVEPDTMEDPRLPLTLPSSVDWVAAGAVTPVKNQGGCGSCWDFSAIASLEGAYAIQQGHLHNATSFSEQEILDCDHKGSCHGGNPSHAWKYNQQKGGGCTEASYPYDSHHKHHNNTCMPCTRVPNSTVGTIVGVKGHTAALMAAAVLQPFTVGVDAKEKHFHLYKSGVMTGSCGTHLDHAVTVVGFGSANVTEGNTTSTVAYFKIKNSWASHWGEHGYIRLAASDHYNGGKGLCGVNMNPMYPAKIH